MNNQFNNKMTEDIVKNCKKFMIHTIVNPGVYWMSEYNTDKCYEAHMKELENLHPDFIEKLPESVNISAGKMVAVLYDEAFHRGLVNDIFYRQGKAFYLILLVAHGFAIETNKENLFLIKDDEITNSKPSIFEVSLYGIQPAILDININTHLTCGAFQKKKCNQWSAFAYKFVKKVFDKNPVVFVNPINLNGRKMMGEIYFVQKVQEKPISLSETLCAKGFAVFTTLNNNDDQRNLSINIEEKIPKKAFKLED